jgi:predicted nucleic acid-binding protein
MILVDTSVWIDFFAGRDLPHVAKLEQSILDNEDLALSGIILTEILQGIADDTTYRRVRRYLGVLILLPMPESVFVRIAPAGCNTKVCHMSPYSNRPHLR